MANLRSIPQSKMIRMGALDVVLKLLEPGALGEDTDLKGVLWDDVGQLSPWDSWRSHGLE